MQRDVTKVSWDGKRVLVRYEIPRGEGVDELELSCVQAPDRPLLDALADALKAIKALGVNAAKIVDEVAPEPKPAPKTPVKKAAKKTTKKARAK